MLKLDCLDARNRNVRKAYKASNLARKPLHVLGAEVAARAKNAGFYHSNTNMVRLHL